MTQSARTPVWKSIAETLENEIEHGHYRAGDKLPTEAELASRFGVNRHTVRRALGDMAERNILRSRRGAGVFVESAPTDYPIGKRVSFTQNIQATGRLPNKQLLRLEERSCDSSEAKVLDIPIGAPVLVYEGLSLSGDTPIAHFVSIFPSERFPHMSEILKTVSSVTETLKHQGIDDYVRRDTRITAELATPVQALHLRIRAGDPLLKSVGVNTTLDGTPIEQGQTWFAAERVALTVARD
ncbi:phosphonate metabolism transcriptional regulator PhnF [Cochlodiniinecator piscidefendens]|uniref:phosphonate metabolism transcriptional regulator PhnF n=1 Tax=Cochlodiniinecator piscidefendens TaxID=2715756 RepID=UPI001409509C|nr:phosphonate metabolism transcriptional regulator PhnF [Cochlodiniinecator piscidefendens]